MGLKAHISFVDLVKKNGSVSLFLFGKHGLFESSATASMTVPCMGHGGDQIYMLDFANQTVCLVQFSTFQQSI